MHTTTATTAGTDDPNARRIYTITHAGETHACVPFHDVPALLARLTAKAPGIPQVREVLDAASTAAEVAPEPAAPAPQPSAPVSPASAPVSPALGTGGWHAALVVGGVSAPRAGTAVAPAYTATNEGRGEVVDQRGRARSRADFEAAEKAGFAPAQSLYTRGTRVIDVGVQNATLFREQYERKPLIGDACDALVGKVEAEQRQDVVMRRIDVQMLDNGMVVDLGAEEDDARRVHGVEPTPLLIEQKPFGQLTRRLGLPEGAGMYLSQCWPELRAENVNQWQQRARDAERFAEEKTQLAGGTHVHEHLKMRTRLDTKGRAIYAVVSDGYNTEFDVDKLARAVKLALPPEARAEVHYDGFRARITALFHSTVNPKDYVAGEFFRAGIVVRTDDTGGGSVTGYAVVEQNLCLNLYILSKKAVPIFRVRHIGDPVALATKIKEGLKKGEEALSHFLDAWGYARRDDIAAAAKERGELYEGMSATAIFAALANGVIERELVPVTGKRTQVVSDLVMAWERDKSADGPRAGTITRAGLTNAFTRWAHESQDDPFFADHVQAAASALLWPGDRQQKPVTIPAVPLDLL